MNEIKGTIDFRYEPDHDLVIARPRWTLDTPSEVMRWYQLHANYFKARFSGPRDLITVNDAFDVVPRVATLWGSYRAKLHEAFVRYSVPVNNNARVRLTTNTSGVRYSLSTVEAPSLEDAIGAILAIREAKRSSQPLSEAFRSGTRSSMHSPAVSASVAQDGKQKG